MGRRCCFWACGNWVLFLPKSSGMLHQAPFIRIGLPALLGIACYTLFPLDADWMLFISFFLFLGACLFVLPFAFFRDWPIRYNLVFGVLVSVSLFSFFYAYAHMRRPPQPVLPLEPMPVKAILNEAPQEREKSYRCQARLLYCYTDSGIRQLNADVMLYFSKEIDCSPWAPDDTISAYLRLNRIAGPKNPGEFDMARFYAQKGMYYSAYVSPKHVFAHQSFRAWSFRNRMHRVRNYTASIADPYFSSETERGLAKALVLGNKSELDAETIKEFSVSGTSHVLAVSGLHVGIMWLVVERLLFFLNRRRGTRILKFVISVSLLWAYALLTGMSPSVLRAAIMFTFFATAGMLNRRYHSMNILFASGLFLLILDPQVLFLPGFQLSYLAVAGILLLYKPFRDAVYSSKKWLVKIWELTALTLAAQVATTPVSLFWFGQFPVWFAFANLPIVPLSGITLQSGIAAFALHWIPGLGDAVFWLFKWLVKLLGLLASFFASLPYSLVYLQVSVLEVFYLYGFFFLLGFYVLKRSPALFKAVLLALIGFVALQVYAEFQKEKTENLVVYALKNGVVMRYHHQDRVYEYRSAEVDDKSYGFSVAPSDRHFGVRTKQVVPAFNGFVQLGPYKIVHLQQTNRKFNPPAPLACDFVIVGKLSYLNFDRLQEQFRFRKLILSGGSSLKARNFWKKECVKRRIPFVDINETGAWMYNN